MNILLEKPKNIKIAKIPTIRLNDDMVGSFYLEQNLSIIYLNIFDVITRRITSKYIKFSDNQDLFNLLENSNVKDSDSCYLHLKLYKSLTSYLYSSHLSPDLNNEDLINKSLILLENPSLELNIEVFNYEDIDKKVVISLPISLLENQIELFHEFAKTYVTGWYAEALKSLKDRIHNEKVQEKNQNRREKVELKRLLNKHGLPEGYSK